MPVMTDKSHPKPKLPEPSSKRVCQDQFSMNSGDSHSVQTTSSASNTHAHSPSDNLEHNPIPNNNHQPLPPTTNINNGSQNIGSETSGLDRHAIDLVSQKHGPKFLKLASEEQSWLIKVHWNLGHPGTQKLVEFCRQLQCPDHFLHAIPDMHCSTCQETQQPKLARPAAIHEPMDFGDVVSMDGITWTNSRGDQFHFYHFLDQAMSYHTAVCSVSRTATSATQALLQGWLQWAGAPRLLVFDAATEFCSDEFDQFLQKFGIRSRTCATDAHWQNSRVERHGGTLQMMLTKMDHEENIKSYAHLAQATATKNQWSRHRGYPPEILVFGKSIRNPASVLNDEEQAAHEMALRPQAEGLRFRAELECREHARRPFAAVDNDQTLRRALNSRSGPHRAIEVNTMQGIMS